MRKYVLLMAPSINGIKSIEHIKYCLEHPEEYLFIPRRLPNGPKSDVNLEIGAHNNKDVIKSFGFYYFADNLNPDREEILTILKEYYGEIVVNKI